MANASTETVTIKRYPNRRLYDRQSRRYITLQDLEDLVKAGKKIEVRDSRTGEDLTRAILTQILLERHPEKMEMFPVAMLHGILQANDLVLEFMRSYLRQSLALLEQMQMQPPATPLNPFLTPIDWMRAMMPATLPFAPAPPRVPESSVPLQQNLAARLSELEERLQRLEAPESADANEGAVARDHGSALPGAGSVRAGQAVVEDLEERLSELEEQAERARGGTG
jgi:polyhydroxyalkanoate synthesis repressor PhaR